MVGRIRRRPKGIARVSTVQSERSYREKIVTIEMGKRRIKLQIHEPNVKHLSSSSKKKEKRENKQQITNTHTSKSTGKWSKQSTENLSLTLQTVGRSTRYGKLFVY